MGRSVIVARARVRRCCGEGGVMRLLPAVSCRGLQAYRRDFLGVPREVHHQSPWRRDGVVYVRVVVAVVVVVFVKTKRGGERVQVCKEGCWVAARAASESRIETWGAIETSGEDE